MNTIIEEYINKLNREEEKNIIIDFLNFIIEKYPKLKLKISYSIPMFLINNKMKEGYIGISTAKEHFSIHFSDEEFILGLKQKLIKCKFGKRCIKIKYNDDESFNIVKENIKDFLIKNHYTN